MQGRVGRVPRGWMEPSVTKALPSLDIGQVDNIPRTLLRKKKKKSRRKIKISYTRKIIFISPNAVFDSYRKS